MSRHLRIRKSQTPQIRFCIFKAKWPGNVDKLFLGRRQNLIAGLILRRIAKNPVICRRCVANILELLFWHVARHATVGRRRGLSTCKWRPAGLDLMASETSPAKVLCRLRPVQLHVRIMAADATEASFAGDRTLAQS